MPIAPSEWRTDSIDMTSCLGEDFLSISFRNYGNWSQMLYVDNINLGDQAVAIEAAAFERMGFLLPESSYCKWPG